MGKRVPAVAGADGQRDLGARQRLRVLARTFECGEPVARIVFHAQRHQRQALVVHRIAVGQSHAGATELPERGEQGVAQVDRYVPADDGGAGAETAHLDTVRKAHDAVGACAYAGGQRHVGATGLDARGMARGTRVPAPGQVCAVATVDRDDARHLVRLAHGAIGIAHLALFGGHEDG